MDAAYHVAYSDGRIAGAVASEGRRRYKSDRIWRYMDLWKLVSMLEHQALYFPVVASLADPLEGIPPKLPEGGSETERFQQWHYWTMWRSTFFASCWHCAADESAAMWKLYASRGQGVAIGSTFGALSDAFPADESSAPANRLRGDLVEYADPDHEESMFRNGDGCRYVLSKRHWYAYEQELRLIIEDIRNFEESNERFNPGHYLRDGKWVRCSLPKLIEVNPWAETRS